MSYAVKGAIICMVIGSLAGGSAWATTGSWRSGVMVSYVATLASIPLADRMIYTAEPAKREESEGDPLD